MTEVEKQKVFSRELYKFVSRMSEELELSLVSVDGCLGTMQMYLFEEALQDAMDIEWESEMDEDTDV